MRRFFWAPKTNVKTDGLKHINILTVNDLVISTNPDRSHLQFIQIREVEMNMHCTINDLERMDALSVSSIRGT